MDEDNLKYVLDRTTELVRNSDNKSSIMIAVVAGLAVILFSNGEFVSAVVETAAHGCIICKALLVVASGALIIFLIALFNSIYPSSRSDGDSLIYAGSICKRSDHESYQRDLADASYSFEEDLINQIYIHSAIFKKKNRCNKIASYSLYTLIVSVMVFVILYLVGGGV